MTKQRAVIELVFAGALWGFGFVATQWALQSFTAVEVLSYRFLIAAFVGEIFSGLFLGSGFKLPRRSDIRLSIPAGALLGTLLILQTIGLQYTTATNSGFITTLYVIIVPVIGHLLFNHPTPGRVYLFVALALFGTVLLVGINPDEINKGDLWTLACAFVAAFHIIYIGRVTKRVENSFRFNNLQSLWAFILLLPLLATQTQLTFQAESGWAWFGILFLALGSSTIGFYIQVRTQKILNTTTASMLFLLESPFAFLFGSLFLKESLNALQWAGALLIMCASYLTIRAEQTSPTKETKYQ